MIIKYNYFHMNVCIFLLSLNGSHPYSLYKLYLEEVRLNPEMMRPAFICTLSDKLFCPCVQLYHLTSLYYSIGQRVD